jgi:hypothetical protein
MIQVMHLLVESKPHKQIPKMLKALAALIIVCTFHCDDLVYPE